MARSSQYPPSVDPGVPVEPTTPRGWSRHTFGELLEVVERPVELEDTRVYQLVNAKRNRGGITPRDRLRGAEIRVKSQFRVEAGDFLVSKRQIIHGACGVVPQELDGAVVSNEYVVLRPRQGLDLSYLRCLSFTRYFQRTCFHSSVGVDVEKMVFKLDQWFRFATPLPPIGEQRRVAALVSAVDSLIEKTEAVSSRADVAKRALMAEMFGEDLGPRHRLDEVCSIVGGFAFSPSLQGERGLPVPFYKVSDMNTPGNEVALRLANNTVSHEMLRTMKAKAYPPGTVVFPKVGAALLTNKRRVLSVTSSFDNNVMGLVPTRISSHFLLYFMQTVDFGSMVQPGAVPSVNGAMVGSITLPVPSAEMQHRIESTLGDFDALQERQQEELSAQRALRSALLDALIFPGPDAQRLMGAA